jgi:hypothetical protein
MSTRWGSPGRRPTFRWSRGRPQTTAIRTYGIQPGWQRPGSTPRGFGHRRGVEALLHWAASGSPAERQAASLALYRGLAPLLDMIGRWPIQFEVREGDAWSPELVDKVQRRYTGLPLQAMANDLLRHVPRATAVRRNVERLNGARDWIARVLFISQRGQ